MCTDKEGRLYIADSSVKILVKQTKLFEKERKTDRWCCGSQGNQVSLIGNESPYSLCVEVPRAWTTWKMRIDSKAH